MSENISYPDWATPAIDYMEPADAEFLSRFEACTLSECEWTHIAHIRVAWVILKLMPLEPATDRLRAGILRYNTVVLKRPDKYHETVTTAFVRIVAARMHDNEPWSEFARRIDDLLNSDEPVLLRYYSEYRLFSDEARINFVEPDLRNLP